MMNICDGMLLLAEILFIILKVFYFICESILTIFIPKTKKSVANEIVLVTGAGQGIGKELAIGYASLGATVVCWDINEETNKQTMNEIKMMGKNAVYAYQCNVTDREEVFKVAENVREEVGDVTILVNNAGAMLQAFLPNMIKKNHGHIVAISSITAFCAAAYGTIYCPTKSAVTALMKAISDELRIHNKEKSLIKFTTIYPFFVSTGFTKNFRTRFPNIIKELKPQTVASLTIDAQRKNLEERSVPSYLLLMLYLKRCLSNKAFYCIYDFINISFDVDD